MLKYKACFIGHRRIEVTNDLKKKFKQIIENLIINHNVLIFLFGSKSDFNHICHSIVTELREKYPKIKRIGYSCKSETFILENERLKWQKIFSNVQNNEINILAVDEELEHKTKYVSGKASYIERNKAMIDDSDWCIFYYDDNYLPESRRYSKRSNYYYQPNSGTRLAYLYAKQKKKQIINLFNIEN